MHLPPPVRVELWPAPEPIVMDGDDPRAYNLLRGPYVHLNSNAPCVEVSEIGRACIYWNRCRRLSARSMTCPSWDLVRMAIAVGAVHP